METISVRCNHCGAALDVGNETRFVTCQFCNSQLEIKRTDSSVFTEEVERIARNTDKMAESMEVIKLQNEIEQLDREWSTRMAQEAPTDKEGHPISKGGAAFGMAFAVFFAIICFGMALVFNMIGGPLFAFVPVGMGIFAVVAGVMGFSKASTVDQSRVAYQERRDELMRKMRSLKRD
jgi:DNA-directed RNA polymerase subunit RPC12/RpoP